MFYSHEVLTSRQHGVATVWLVATLGAKSTLKRVNRKEILAVNVPRACETIITPEAPMALRLQSNLLYGVARVYGEQCGYVLVDAQNAQNNMRGLLRAIKAVELEGKHTSRPDQLVLKDDSRFVLDDLFNLDTGSSHDLDLISSDTSDLDSLLSPRHSGSNRLGSEHADPMLSGINIPPSARSSLGGTRGFSLGGSVHHDGSTKGSRFGSSIFRREDDDRLFDPGFRFDDQGNIVDEVEPAVAIQEPLQQDLPSLRNPTILDDDAEANIGIPSAVNRHGRLEEDDDFMPRRDDWDMHTGVEAFPPREHNADPPRSSPPRRDSHSAEPSEHVTTDSTEESASAPALRIRKKKFILPDERQELRSQDMSQWNTGYAANMQEALRAKLQTRVAALAKRNAEFWVLRNGVGGLATTFSREAMPEPLRLFTGNALLQALTGLKLTASPEKRAREELEGQSVEPDADNNGRRLRARSDDAPLGRSDADDMMYDAGHIGNDGGLEGDVGAADETVEVGREAQTPLADRMSSMMMMPWNTSASIRGSSARPGSRALFPVAGGGGGGGGGLVTSSVGGGSIIGGLRGVSAGGESRLISASPLAHHGEAGDPSINAIQHPASMDVNDDQQENLMTLGAFGDEDGDGGPDAQEQYQLFGPAAAVHTQQADQPAWVRQALDTESINFLSFVQAGIEAAAAVAHEKSKQTSQRLRGRRRVLFDMLLPPADNSRVVAAQGLLHVLSLVTKKLLRAEQDDYFGPINLDIPSVPIDAPAVEA